MYIPISRRASQELSDCSELTDSTFFEAEHIPVKVFMKPHHCSSDPRLKLDLKLIGASSKLPSPVPKLEIGRKKGDCSAQRKVLEREKLVKLHARAASDIISAMKVEPKSPELMLARKKAASRQGKKGGTVSFLPSVVSPCGSQSVKHMGRGNLSPVFSRGLLSPKSTSGFAAAGKLAPALKFRYLNCRE